MIPPSMVEGGGEKGFNQTWQGRLFWAKREKGKSWGGKLSQRAKILTYCTRLGVGVSSGYRKGHRDGTQKVNIEKKNTRRSRGDKITK